MLNFFSSSCRTTLNGCGVLCLALGLLLGGCGDDESITDIRTTDTRTADVATGNDTETPAGERIELGTTLFSSAGETSFGELPTDTGTIKVVFGLQGGYHFEVATRLYDLSADQADGMALDYSVRLEGSDEMLGFPARPILSPRRLNCTDTYCDRVGDRTILNITNPDDVLNQRVVIRVEGTLPLGGGTFSDERTLTVSELEDELSR